MEIAHRNVKHAHRVGRWAWHRPRRGGGGGGGGMNALEVGRAGVEAAQARVGVVDSQNVLPFLCLTSNGPTTTNKASPERRRNTVGINVNGIASKFNVYTSHRTSPHTHRACAKRARRGHRAQQLIFIPHLPFTSLCVCVWISCVNFECVIGRKKCERYTSNLRNHECIFSQITHLRVPPLHGSHNLRSTVRL